MIRRSHVLPLLLASAAIALTSAGALAKVHKHGSADAHGKRSTHSSAGAKPSAGAHAKHLKHAGTEKKKSAEAGGKHSKHDHASRSKSDDHCRAIVPISDAAASPVIEALELIPPDEIETVKQALDLVRKHKPIPRPPRWKKRSTTRWQEACRMGDPALRRHGFVIRPLCGLHSRQSGLAGHHLLPPPRGSCAVARPARRRDRAPFLAGNPASARGAWRSPACSLPTATARAPNA